MLQFVALDTIEKMGAMSGKLLSQNFE